MKNIKFYCIFIPLVVVTLIYYPFSLIFRLKFFERFLYYVLRYLRKFC